MGLPKMPVLLAVGLNPACRFESLREFFQKIPKPEPPPDVQTTLPETEAWDLPSFQSPPSD